MTLRLVHSAGRSKSKLPIVRCILLLAFAACVLLILVSTEAIGTSTGKSADDNVHLFDSRPTRATRTSTSTSTSGRSPTGTSTRSRNESTFTLSHSVLASTGIGDRSETPFAMHSTTMPGSNNTGAVTVTAAEIKFDTHMAFNVTSIDTSTGTRASSTKGVGPKNGTAVPTTNNGSLPPLCLVHVGKTAGGTLTCRLMGSKRKKSRAKPECKTIHPLSSFVTGKLHKHQTEKYLGRSCDDHAQIFLVSLRDPVARIRSWFDYENPRLRRVNEVVGNRPYLYEDICQFDSLEELSLSLKVALEGPEPPYNTTNGTASLTCAKRAWLAITGKVGFQYHNLYNYEYYGKWIDAILMKRQSKRGTRTERRIMVARSEYLQDDWNFLEDFYHTLQDRRTKNDTHFFQSVQMHRSVSTKNNDASAALAGGVKHANPYQHFLCAALCHELIAYRQFLQTAINLSSVQKNQSLSHVDAITCPNTTTVADDCPTLHPAVRAHQDPGGNKYKIQVPIGYHTPGGSSKRTANNLRNRLR
mmetsp:Transcript_3902/g.5741  ORF Transcript_3902/g.5741 Transcript_3902/m.5741 type:complete len:528 (+) Transcript_3902:65-1648(+)